MGVKGCGKRGVEELRRRVGRVAAGWVGSRDRGRREVEIAWDKEKGEVGSEGWREGSGG